jgi:hypothetical protein
LLGWHGCSDGERLLVAEFGGHMVTALDEYVNAFVARVERIAGPDARRLEGPGFVGFGGDLGRLLVLDDDAARAMPDLLDGHPFRVITVLDAATQSQALGRWIGTLRDA